MENKMERTYLGNGDVVFTTGAFLVWDVHLKTFVLKEIDGTSDTYYDGELVNFDEHGLPFIGEDLEDEE